MGRNIVIAKLSSDREISHAPAASVPDNYASQIVKLIPADIVGVYLGIQNLFSGVSENTKFILQSAIFLIILAISPAYLKRVAGMTDSRQRMVAIISYCIWGISLGGPFEHLLSMAHAEITAQQIGGALIMLYTLIVPLLYKPAA